MSRAFLWGTGVTPDGQREVLGRLDWSTETGRAWAELFRIDPRRGRLCQSPKPSLGPAV